MLGRAAALLTAGPLPAALLTAVRPGRSALVRAVHVESRLTELGITLPPPGGPKANYQTACFESPTLLYVSGHLPVKLDGSMVTGSLGPGGLSLDEGVEAARWCGLNLISTISDRLGGDLDRVEQVVKLFGIVNSKQDFTEQHLVLNGASDLMMEVFGDRGYHARSAIGTHTLTLTLALVLTLARARALWPLTPTLALTQTLALTLTLALALAQTRHQHASARHRGGGGGRRQGAPAVKL